MGWSAGGLGRSSGWGPCLPFLQKCGALRHLPLLFQAGADDPALDVEPSYGGKEAWQKKAISEEKVGEPGAGAEQGQKKDGAGERKQRKEEKDIVLKGSRESIRSVPREGQPRLKLRT